MMTVGFKQYRKTLDAEQRKKKKEMVPMTDTEKVLSLKLVYITVDLDNFQTYLEQ